MRVQPLFLAALMAGLAAAICQGPGFAEHRAQKEGIVLSTPEGAAYPLVSAIPLSTNPNFLLQHGILSFAGGQEELGVPDTDANIQQKIRRGLAALAGGRTEIRLDGAVFLLDFGAPAAGGAAPEKEHSPAPLPDGGAAAGSKEVPAPLPESASAGKLIELLQAARFRSLEMEDATLVIRLSPERQERIAHIAAAVTVPYPGALAAKGRFQYRGQTFSFSARLGLPEGTGPGTGEHRPLSLTLQGALFDAQVQGHLALGSQSHLVAEDANVSVPDLRNLSRWLAAPLPPGSGLKNFRASGFMRWAGGAITFEEAAFSLDGNSAKGTLSFALDGSKPQIEGTLAMERLDCTPYLVAAGLPAPDSKGPGRFAVPQLVEDAMAGPFAVPLITHIEADLRLSAERIVLEAMELGRAAASISVDGGRLAADIAEVSLGPEASASGLFSLDMNGARPAYTLSGRLENVSADVATALVIGGKVAEGPADIQADLSARGATKEALLASLTGEVKAAMLDGGSLLFDSEALFAPPLSEGKERWERTRAGKTRFSSLTGALAFTGRVARPEVTVITENGRRLVLSGRIGTVTHALDLRLSASAPEKAPVAEGRGEEDAASLPDPGNPSRPLEAAAEIRGTWNAPQLESFTTLPAAGTGAEPPASQGGDTGETRKDTPP